MKNGARNVLLAASTLFLGCQATDAEVDREAEQKCWVPPPSPGALPLRWEAEELPSRVSRRVMQYPERDLDASRGRVHMVRFLGVGNTLDYSLGSNQPAETDLWIRFRKGPDHGSIQVWLDDRKARAVTIDAYSATRAFGEQLVGTLPAATSRYPVPHTLHVLVVGKHGASRGFVSAIDFIEQRQAAPAGPCKGVADGAACDDGNACTRTDRCQAGACVGADPVVCEQQDACHLRGACDPGTGTCSNPVAADGTACDDRDLCTRQDVCAGGVCTGTDPVVCPNQPACLIQGACAPDTGLCSEASQCSACGNGQTDEGEACDDGNREAGDGCGDTCQIEYCGDGIVQPTFQRLWFQYVGRACGSGPATILFRLNGVVVAQENLPETCECQPGLRTLEVTSAALRAVGVEGLNSFELESYGQIAWALPVVYTRTMAVSIGLWNTWGQYAMGDAAADFCQVQAEPSVGTGTSATIVGGEACDDGNDVDEDACNNTCQVP